MLGCWVDYVVYLKWHRVPLTKTGLGYASFGLLMTPKEDVFDVISFTDKGY